MTYPNDANVYLPGTVQIPSALEIVAISQSNPMVVTVVVDSITAANTYRQGQAVRLNIPASYGMQQANGITATLLEVSGSDLSLDVNSTNFDPFSVPSSGIKPASLSPAGSRNLQYTNNFMNQVAFQCLNNRGN